jgi:Zn-dependent peptidase ImmA (M78 family)
MRESIRELLRIARVTDPPVPVEYIARCLGARVTYEPFVGELSGMLYREGDQIVIGVNVLHPKTRQRFTIAHEIAHLRLHENEGLHLDRDFRIRHRDELSSQGSDRDEVAANHYAASLLMPKEMIERDLDGRRIDIEDDDFVRELADRYKVSQQAMTFRLANLGYIPDIDLLREQ